MMRKILMVVLASLIALPILAEQKQPTPTAAANQEVKAEKKEKPKAGETTKQGEVKPTVTPQQGTRIPVKGNEFVKLLASQPAPLQKTYCGTCGKYKIYSNGSCKGWERACD